MSPDPSSDGLSPAQEALPPFEMIYDRYYIPVYRYMHAHLHHEQDAADLTQQVFFQAWQHRETYRPERGAVATWLLSIAHHRLVDFYRQSRPALSWESIPDMAATDHNPEATVLTEESMALIRMLLEALPQAEQDLLALRFAARLTSAEIAAIIGKSEAATKKHLTRLLHRLQEQYRRQELETPLPNRLEPALPAFVSALLQVYAVAPPKSGDAIRQNLLALLYTVS